MSNVSQVAASNSFTLVAMNSAALSSCMPAAQEGKDERKLAIVQRMFSSCMRAFEVETDGVFMYTVNDPENFLNLCLPKL